MGNYWSEDAAQPDPALDRIRALEARLNSLEGRLGPDRPPTPRPPALPVAMRAAPSWHGELLKKLEDRRGKLDMDA